VRVTRSWAAGLLNSAICTAVALAMCGWLLPGATLNRWGLLIATAVIALPQGALDLYLTNEKRLGRWGTAFTSAAIWLLVGPAVADSATTEFNVGGLWQYVVLVVVLFGVAFALWPVWRAAGRIGRYRR
jgi:hypothetical protein